MSMQLENSLQWQADSVAAHIDRLRATLGEAADEQTLAAMAALYRAGWSDCYKFARLHGVERL